MLRKYISYFLKCYQSDNRDFGVLNFFSSKYENQYLLKEEELANGKYPIQFLPTKQAENIEQTLALFNNDKELFYGVLFSLGKRKSFQKRLSNIAAPLFFYKASLIKKDEYYLKIDSNSRQVNIPFFKSLDYATSFDLFYSDLEVLLENHSKIDFDFISLFKKLTKKHIQNYNEELLVFPKLKTSTFLKKELQTISKPEQFITHSAAGIFISSKANNNNAVVNELELLEKTSEYSSGLVSFFSKEHETIKNQESLLKTPILLNSSQEKIIFNANNYKKSVIFGPPGTGKTYTVSAIAKDYVTQGKSVLIVTKTSQALNVIEEKLSKFKLSKVVTKVGGNYYKRRLLSHLKKISTGFYHKYHSEFELSEATKNRNSSLSKLRSLEEQFSEKIDKEHSRVERLFSESFLKQTLHKIDVNWLRNYETSEAKIIDQYFTALKDYERNADTYVFKSIVKQIITHSNTERLELTQLINALETEEKSLKSSYLEKINAKKLLKFLPIWLVKIDEISQALPLQKEIFDVVIIDEATQSDIASCLPIFQRAKKIIVAGDTNQLRHLSFLSTSQMLGFQKKYKIPSEPQFNYRKKSVLEYTLDTTTSGQQIVLLDEHYRSLPKIISFSNETFYNSSLRIMTQTPTNNKKEAVTLHNTTGKQLNNGTNPIEAEKVLEKMKEIVLEEIELPKEKSTSIGVLSPFRQQTDYIAKLVKSEVSLSDIKKHKIRLGTPYHFQGEERDIMLLSFTIDNNSHVAGYNYLNRTDVFNVSITRARHHQHVFTSFDANLLKPNTLLKDYIYSLNKSFSTTNSITFSDNFSDEVIAFLESLECKTYTSYFIAGLSIDILANQNGHYFGIDLIGYPGSFKEAFSLERYKIMNRVGVSILPISYISWKHQKEKIKQLISNKIRNLS